MFKIERDDLLIGGYLWVFQVYETILDNHLVPLRYRYDGRYSPPEEEEYFLFISETEEELRVYYDKNGYMPDEIYDSGRYIIAPTRTMAIQVIRNVATRPAMDDMLHNIPSRYLKLLNKIKPELLI